MAWVEAAIFADAFSAVVPVIMNQTNAVHAGEMDLEQTKISPEVLHRYAVIAERGNREIGRQIVESPTEAHAKVVGIGALWEVYRIHLLDDTIVFRVEREDETHHDGTHSLGCHQATPAAGEQRAATEIPAFDDTSTASQQMPKVASPTFDSKPLMKRIPLHSLQDGYFIFDAHSDQALGISWLDYAADRYICEDSLWDGSWAIEAYRLEDRDVAPFRIYWLYPLSSRVHYWTLDNWGNRVQGLDLSPAESLSFFRQRLEEGPTFLTRLFLLLAESRPALIDPGMIERVVSLAMHNAVEEALFCVCSYPEYFAPDALDRAIDSVIEWSSLTRAVPHPLHGEAVRKRRLTAFEEALQRCKPSRLSDLREQIALATNYSDVLNTARSHGGIVPVARMQHIILHQKTYEEMAGICAPIQNAALVFRVEFSPNGDHPLVVCHTSASGMLHRRLLLCIGFMYTVLCQHIGREDFLGRSNALGFRPHERRSFLFQGWDDPSETERPSVSFERSVGNTLITLVPDLYYFESHGYRDMTASLRETAVRWADKRSAFMWRGSTTGHFITLDNFDTLPRYRLCRAGQALGAHFDAGITDIVQTDSPETQTAIAARLREEGLLLPYVPQARMSEYRYVIDIDGNSNSWGFFAKLLLGSCVLKVASRFEQWFYPELEAWTHYVPISADLDNLAEIVDWCLTHDAECEKIAKAGFEFALERTIERENTLAAHAVLAASLPAA